MEATSAGSGTPNVRLNTVSTVDAAANVLRELILDGELEPGSRLREAEFAERLGIARHSFRAATQVLISEGMLRREPHRGVQVTVLTAPDILDTFRLRAALETEAVRLAIAAGDPALADELFRRHLTDAVRNLSSALAAGEGTNPEEVIL